MKKYKIKPTKKQLLIMKDYWARMNGVQNYYYRSLGELEKEMSIKTGIKDLEFFFCDNEIVGIGQGNREMALIQREKLNG
jgi:hypothetical protein